MRRLVSFFGERTPIFNGLNQEIAAYAAQKGIEYIWKPQVPFDREQVITFLQDADAGLIDVEPYDESIFGQLGDRCKLLIRFGVGFDKVDLKAASRHGLCVARTTGTLSDSVAEMALLHILALRRQLRINRKTVESGVWVKNIGSETVGKTIGIFGFGAIGKRLAGLLRGFECQVLVYDPFLTADQVEEWKVEQVSLEELFARSDAISIHAPYSPQTHMVVNRDLISRMKPDAVLSCTARGKIVDEQALYEALRDGRIAGAGLDVFAQEPCAKDNPLLTLDNVVLTPHVSSQTREALWATYRKAVDIMDDFFAGRPLLPADLLNPDYITGG